METMSEEAPPGTVRESVTDDDLYEALREYGHPVAYASEHPHMAEPPDSGKNKSLEIEGAVEVTLDYRLFMPNTILLDQYLSAELQIAGVDRVAIEYRRWLRDIAKGSHAARQAAGQ